MRAGLRVCACLYVCCSLIPTAFIDAGVDWGHRRDQDVRLDFPTLAKALEKVALGEVRGGGSVRLPTPPCEVHSSSGRRHVTLAAHAGGWQLGNVSAAHLSHDAAAQVRWVASGVGHHRLCSCCS